MEDGSGWLGKGDLNILIKDHSSSKHACARQCKRCRRTLEEVCQAISSSCMYKLSPMDANPTATVVSVSVCYSGVLTPGYFIHATTKMTSKMYYGH